MTRGERLAKLEALLERVRARSMEPRSFSNGAGAEKADGVAAAASMARATSGVAAPPQTAAGFPAAAPAHPATSSVAGAPPQAAAADGFGEAASGWTAAPPPAVPSEAAPPFEEPATLAGRKGTAEAVEEAELSVDVDVDVDVDIEVVSVHETAAPAALQEEAPVSDGLDSRERLVAAQPVDVEAPGAGGSSEGPAETVAAGAAGAVPAAGEHGPALESAPPTDMADAEAAAEEPPVSSQRPVVGAEPEERLARMAFGTDEPPPLHTPPPESGRLPAAPEFDRDVTGVRSSGPLANRREPEQAPPPARELVPEMTRTELAPSEAVADWVPEAQRFAPQTFLALLDASLGL